MKRIGMDTCLEPRIRKTLQSSRSPGINLQTSTPKTQDLSGGNKTQIRRPTGAEGQEEGRAGRRRCGGDVFLIQIQLKHARLGQARSEVWSYFFCSGASLCIYLFSYNIYRQIDRYCIGKRARHIMKNSFLTNKINILKRREYIVVTILLQISQGWRRRWRKRRVQIER